MPNHKAKRHVKVNTIMTEDYPRSEIAKTNSPQTLGKNNKEINHFMRLNEHKNSEMYETNEGYTKNTRVMELILIQSPGKAGQHNNDENCYSENRMNDIHTINKQILT